MRMPLRTARPTAFAATMLLAWPALAASLLPAPASGTASAKTPARAAAAKKGKTAVTTSSTRNAPPAPVVFGADWVEYGGAWTLNGNRARVSAADSPKIVATRALPRDFDISLRLRIAEEKGQAGVLFRVTDPVEGRDAHNGYWLGLDADLQKAIFGRMSRDGNTWTGLVERGMPVRKGVWYEVRIIAHGDRIRAFVHRQGAPLAKPEWPILDVEDSTHPSGSLGLRALGVDAAFENVVVRRPAPLPKGPTYSNAGGLVPDIADPHVLKWNGEYYAYGTGGHGLRVYRSKDLVHWSGAAGATDGYALHPKDSWGTKWWWAPEVYRKGDGFLMYYSIEEHLGFAEGRSPLGPFVQDPKQPRRADRYEIDSHLFIDDGKPYIYYVPRNRGNVIAVAELEDDWKTFKDEAVHEILRQSQPWESDSVNEGPFVLKHKGLYYLMYSGNGFTNPNYGVGFATAKHPMGPWTKYEHNPILRSNAYVQGVGHHAVTTSPDGREMFAVYHTHKSPTDRWPRQMAIDRIRFAPNPEGGPDILEAYGPTLTPQPMPSGAVSR